MFCENCGKLLEKGEKICPVCGTVVSEEEENKSVKTENSNIDLETSNKSIRKFIERNKKQIIIIAAVLLIIIIISIIASTVNKKDDAYSNITNSNYAEETNNNYGNTTEEEPETEEETEYQPTYKTIDVSPIKENEITIDKATIDIHKGNITEEGQVDEYSFTVPRDGRYRFELSEIRSGTSVDLKLINSLGETIATNYGAKNWDGLTVKNLETDDKYIIKVIQNSGMGSYILSVGNQKEIIDVTEKTKIFDSVEFTDQRNVYKFVVPRDGRYHFELSEVHNGTSFDFLVFNHLGDTIGTNYGAGNKDGITIKDLKQGEECTIQIRQSTNFGSYQLCIGFQKEIIEVSPNTIINDSIQYIDQRNVYNFTCEDSMSHTVTITGLSDSCSVDLKSFNHLGETITTNYGARNGDTIAINENCTIQVVQKSDISDYSIAID